MSTMGILGTAPIVCPVTKEATTSISMAGDGVEPYALGVGSSTMGIMGAIPFVT